MQIFVVAIGGVWVIKLTAPHILGTTIFSADQIIELTNVKRGENGAGKVTFNPLLAQAAAAKAQNMFAENYWSHYSPSGKSPWSFMNTVGYKYVYAGENLARDFNDAQSVVTAWMNSASHKSNLLDKNFKEIGVAVASGKLTGQEGILVVQMFGSPVSQVNTTQTLAQASPIPTPAVSPSPTAARNPFIVASPIASPSSITIPSPSVEPTPIAIAQADIIVPFDGAAQEATVLGGRQFSTTRFVTLGLVGLIFAMFAIEVIVVSRKEHLKLRSGVWAHLGILAFLLLVIWYAVSGAIL